MSGASVVPLLPRHEWSGQAAEYEGLTFDAQFPQAFARIVIPKLERHIKVAAWLLALDMELRGDRTWSNTQQDVVDMASAWGASRLPNQVWWDLIDWIDRNLIEELDSAERGVARSLATQKAALSDPVRSVAFWDWLVSGSMPDDQRAMERIGISLCPHYRAAWNARQAKMHGNVASRRQEFLRSPALQALRRRKLEGYARDRAAEATAGAMGKATAS